MTQTDVQMDKIKAALGNDCACFVLISCGLPSADGKMEVSMNYEGDESLAAFLVDNASQVFGEKIQALESQ